MRIVRILSASLKALRSKVVIEKSLPAAFVAYSNSSFLSKADSAAGGMGESLEVASILSHFNTDNFTGVIDGISAAAHSLGDVDSHLIELSSELGKRNVEWEKVGGMIAAIGVISIPETIQARLIRRAIDAGDEDTVIEVLKDLIDRHHLNVNAKDKAGNVAIYVASDKSTEKVVEFLLSRKANPNVECSGDTPYRVAAARAKEDDEPGLGILKLLFGSHRPDVHVLNEVCTFLIAGSKHVEEEGRKLIGDDSWDSMVGELSVA